MKGWRQVIQKWRALATAGRFCSFASGLEPVAPHWLTAQVFFVCETKAMQPGAHTGAGNLQTVRAPELGDRFINRWIALF